MFVNVWNILQAVERRGEMIVRILELRQVGRNNIEAAKKFFALQVRAQNFYVYYLLYDKSQCHKR